LLDVGCATGNFIKDLANTGNWRVTGVEPDPYAANIAAGKGLTIINEPFETAPIEENSFDVITFWDVLEHMHFPLEGLKKAWSLLDDHGLILLRLPNAASWDARLFQHYWAGIDAPRHLYLFDPTTINDLLTRAGFRVLANSSQIGNYLNFVKSIRFYMAGNHWPPWIRATVLFLFTNPITRIMAYPLFYLLAMNNRGSSMTIMATKVPGG